MISEMERLDKELTLATDIQSSMLPDVFPPYPDRTEFDLYASSVAGLCPDPAAICAPGSLGTHPKPRNHTSCELSLYLC